MERVVVGIGAAELRMCRTPRAIGRAVVQEILATCNAPKSDVHDPSKADGRSRTRDKFGHNRRDFVGWSETDKSKHRARHEAWDTAPMCDFGGVWCDRLVLGEPARRSAVLQPVWGVESSGDSLAMVFQAHPALLPEHVLLVAEDHSLPIGTSTMSQCRNVDPQSCHVGVQSCLKAVGRSRGAQRATDTWTLRVGVGSSCAPLEEFSTVEWSQSIARYVIPFNAFLAAFWCSSPVKATEYLAKQKSALEAPNLRLWRTMQRSMLSTRDEAIMEAYKSGHGVSKMMSPDKVALEADKIVERSRQAASRSLARRAPIQ